MHDQMLQAALDVLALPAEDVPNLIGRPWCCAIRCCN
jgi:hypothetical protein